MTGVQWQTLTAHSTGYFLFFQFSPDSVSSSVFHTVHLVQTSEVDRQQHLIIWKIPRNAK
eukprot:4000324-Amphidinium_carterae.1